MKLKQTKGIVCVGCLCFQFPFIPQHTEADFPGMSRKFLLLRSLGCCFQWSLFGFHFTKLLSSIRPNLLFFLLKYSLFWGSMIAPSLGSLTSLFLLILCWKRYNPLTLVPGALSCLHSLPRWTRLFSLFKYHLYADSLAFTTGFFFFSFSEENQVCVVKARLFAFFHLITFPHFFGTWAARIWRVIIASFNYPTPHSSLTTSSPLTSPIVSTSKIYLNFMHCLCLHCHHHSLANSFLSYCKTLPILLSTWVLATPHLEQLFPIQQPEYFFFQRLRSDHVIPLCNGSHFT